jgi:hypothetical protein
VKSAIIAAVVAAVVAPSTVVATSWINGRNIRPHSIPLNRLTAIPRGKRGVSGTFDPSKVKIVLSPVNVAYAGGYGGAEADCPKGDVATGGGGTTGDSRYLTDSYPVSSSGHPTGWSILVANVGIGPVNVQAVAVCAAP